MSTFELSVLFFLQLAVVLLACRAVSQASKWIGQPPVVGEMIAGVLLGPSLLGWLWPAGQQALFPAASRPVLFSGAQIGLSLYMFTVGLDFRTDLMRSRLRGAAAISSAGIVAPFILGCLLAWSLWRRSGFFGPGVTLDEAMPFMGAAMAITAFPTLARMISERGLTGTTVGTLSLAAAAIGDAAAWGVLALVLALLGHDAGIATRAIGGGIVFVALLFTAGRPVLRRIADLGMSGPAGERSALGWMLFLLMVASWFTDTIKLYAVFGAFFVGAALPRGPFATRLQTLVEPLISTLLLPLFFVYSGLNTRLDLVTGGPLWLVTLAILAAAVLGKTGACYFAARWSGETRQDSLGIGALMNARGLMELIILNIGLERGIITPTLFSILVFMAMATTLMSTPMFNFIFGSKTILPRMPVIE